MGNVIKFRRCRDSGKDVVVNKLKGMIKEVKQGRIKAIGFVIDREGGDVQFNYDIVRNSGIALVAGCDFLKRRVMEDMLCQGEGGGYDGAG